MFSKAVKLAREFTRPVLISVVRHDGQCESMLGTFIIINKEGHFATVAHLAAKLPELVQARQAYIHIVSQREAIKNDTSLQPKERDRALRGISKLKDNNLADFSPLWGVWPSCSATLLHVDATQDIAIGQLAPFDPSWITEYPVFRNDGDSAVVGTSLCRLGFPFSQILPVYEASSQRFTLPPGSWPPPVFPIDGICTRLWEESPATSTTAPVRFLETSSPGLMGQSGGPILDTEGRIWGMQCRTHHLPLGFSPPVPNGKKGEVEHQFINLGWGAHVSSITRRLTDLKIPFQSE